ncbi:hypothetical protein V2K55_04265 [Pseudomonas alliivorans]|uniref:PA0061/PA0062 family lipoprotein n=1 Tax=Pseudomonas alliivorans TaxID=2810613 RepID=UPI001F174768|nr:hypothetical protein [Pseudomonas alliivorans]MEE4622991.1 hypothetical protein [Pseudomonas alliivorans]MEE4704898.1 hypothetical protein [Pseudomonas alliivorans]MEE4743032.1 hypothetical protein [Pseudomonas alliivorans]MEE4775688.1 hypothetical protein [Pseudomonas alliivorans]MEE4909900.1 hypothetical protein [Pseudomonas alliivorans]
MKFLKLAAFVVAVSGLAGCATAMPVPDKGNAIVHIEAQVGDEMIARRLDTKPAESLNHFEVSPGKHSMELGIVARGYQKSQRRCVATLEYSGFAADELYTLVESRSGPEVKVTLVDNKGKALAQTDKVPCL